MDPKEEEFVQRLRVTFEAEAVEHLKAISSGLIELENLPAADRQAELIELLFREAHSLKGAARTVDLGEVEAVCHSLEGLYAALKHGELSPTRELFDLTHEAVDLLKELTRSSRKPLPQEEQRVTGLVERIDGASEGVASVSRTDGPTPVPGPPPRSLATPAPAPDGRSSDRAPPSAEPREAEEVRAPLAETARVSIAKLEQMLSHAEELATVKLAARQHVADLRELKESLRRAEREWERRAPETRRLARLTSHGGERQAGAGPCAHCDDLLRFLDSARGWTKGLDHQVATLTAAAERDERAVDATVDGLLEEAKSILMMPFSVLLEPLPRLIRDLSRDGGKEAELVVEGEDIEVDKRILEGLKDPLIHLIRNAIDHGIEEPDERVRRGKPSRGRIRISISRTESGRIEVQVTDDGAGIDPRVVIDHALRQGLISAEKAAELADSEALQLVFDSGLSTSSALTNISGRGLGLAIVRENVENLGGSVSIRTQPKAGTAFVFEVPLAVAAFRGVLVRAGGRVSVVPAAGTDRAMRLSEGAIKSVEGTRTVQLGDLAVPYVELAEALELPPGESKGDGGKVTAVVLGYADRRVAFGVDEILGEQEVFIKSLGTQLSRVRNVSGAAVLGTGQLVPVLNVHDLIRSAACTAPADRGAPTRKQKERTRRGSILVVEDSITSRVLLKNSLESAGYDVATTVDGVDGFSALQSHQFDLVVSDVQMPRMDGFDLTANIRSNDRLSDTPVVLVTALDSTEDRKRGIDAGADAYIVKSSFDQSDLLGIIKRLIRGGVGE